MRMPLPRELRRSIERAVEKLTGLTAAPGGPAPLFAVRSSAWDEDSESSFAGMYETVLGVGAGGILDAYRQVLASLFCEEALRYRLHHGLCHEEPAMAVGVMRKTVSGRLARRASSSSTTCRDWPPRSM